MLLHITTDSWIHQAGETCISVEEERRTRKCFAGLGHRRAPHNKKAGFPARPPLMGADASGALSFAVEQYMDDEATSNLSVSLLRLGLSTQLSVSKQFSPLED